MENNMYYGPAIGFHYGDPMPGDMPVTSAPPAPQGYVALFDASGAFVSWQAADPAAANAALIAQMADLESRTGAAVARYYRDMALQLPEGTPGRDKVAAVEAQIAKLRAQLLPIPQK